MWLRYQYGSGSLETRSVSMLRHFSNRDTIGSETITLRKRRVRKIEATFPFHDLAIGMDELYVPATKTWVDAWWEADRAWIHLSTDPETEPVELDAGWIEVSLPLGPVPYSYPTQDKSLPSFAATIYETQGV